MIIAKVAKIINERSLVINKGSEDGVKNGFYL
jgi:cell shape-determining protein MreC